MCPLCPPGQANLKIPRHLPTKFLPAFAVHAALYGSPFRFTEAAAGAQLFDLKSPGASRRAGSIPAPGTILLGF